VEATNFHETGLETTVVATVGYRFLLYNMNLDLFSDLAEAGPAIDWRSTLSWWLTPELSLDYNEPGGPAVAVPLLDRLVASAGRIADGKPWVGGRSCVPAGAAGPRCVRSPDPGGVAAPSRQMQIRAVQ